MRDEKTAPENPERSNRYQPVIASYLLDELLVK